MSLYDAFQTPQLWLLERTAEPPVAEARLMALLERMPATMNKTAYSIATTPIEYEHIDLLPVLRLDVQAKFKISRAVSMWEAAFLRISCRW